MRTLEAPARQALDAAFIEAFREFEACELARKDRLNALAGRAGLDGQLQVELRREEPALVARLDELGQRTQAMSAGQANAHLAMVQSSRLATALREAPFFRQILERPRGLLRAHPLGQLGAARGEHAAEAGIHVLVLAEAEDGGVAERAQRPAPEAHDIRGNETIQKWIRKLGKNHLLNKVVRIEIKDEQERIKALERQVKALESALAKAQVKTIPLESLIECADEHYQVDFKKNFGGKECGGEKEGEQH